jgi:hypothetical protein
MKIVAIHVCTDGKVYIQRENDQWYLAGEEDHFFAEVANWNENYWKSKERDLPCAAGESGRTGDHLEIRDILLAAGKRPRE